MELSVYLSCLIKAEETTKSWIVRCEQASSDTQKAIAWAMANVGVKFFQDNLEDCSVEHDLPKEQVLAMVEEQKLLSRRN